MNTSAERPERPERPERRNLDRIAKGAAALLDVPLVLISMLDGGTQEIVGAHGLAIHAVRGGEGCVLCRDVAYSSRPILVQDARRRPPPASNGGWGIEVVAYAGVPLALFDGQRLGTLAAFAPVQRTWQSRDLLVLRSFAEAAAAIIEMHGEREATKVREQVATDDHDRIALELEQTSNRDELTGLLNRRGLFAVGNAQLESLRRAARSGLLFYIDIDNLKTTNDRCGHAGGDDLLRAAADVLRSSFPESDTIARLGGDEFVVVAADTQRGEHLALVARLTAELDRCNGQRARANQLAWSLGLVAIEPTTPHDLAALMSEADRRMYLAKPRPVPNDPTGT